MTRLLVTLWFAATALLGPVLCCCGAKAVTPEPVSSKPAGPPPAGGHHKSCCHHTTESPPTPADPPAPAAPDQCPCPLQHQTDRLTAGTTAAEVAAQARLLDGVWFVLLPSDAEDVTPTRLVSGGGESAGIHRPAGRDLLSAYQILRC